MAFHQGDFQTAGFRFYWGLKGVECGILRRWVLVKKELAEFSRSELCTNAGQQSNRVEFMH
jgi:hypothetical protein